MENKYRPTQGDTWESVSYKLYGDSLHVFDLISLNPEMRTIEYFDGTEVLKYAKQADTTTTVVNLPPWR